MIDLQEKFDYFNQTIFRKELPRVPIKIGYSKTFLGKLEYKRKREFNLFHQKQKYYDVLIRISNKFTLSENEIEDVLIHEMIHLCILVKDIKDTSAHGKVFRKMMSEINEKYGRNIRISHKGASLSLRPSSSKTRHIGLSLLISGQYGITVCTETTIKRIALLLPRRYNIKETIWYQSNHPFFLRFPLSRNGAIYKITTDNAQHIINNELDKLE